MAPAVAASSQASSVRIMDLSQGHWSQSCPRRLLLHRCCSSSQHSPANSVISPRPRSRAFHHTVKCAHTVHTSLSTALALQSGMHFHLSLSASALRPQATAPTLTSRAPYAPSPSANPHAPSFAERSGASLGPTVQPMEMPVASTPTVLYRLHPWSAEISATVVRLASRQRAQGQSLF